LRVRPVVEGVQADKTPRAPERPQPSPPPPAPIVIVTQAAPQPPPADPEVIAVPVPVPAGIVFVNAPEQHRSTHATKPAAAPAGAPAPVVAKATPRRDRPGRTPTVKKFRNAAESALVTAIVQELDARSFEKAMTDLESWTQRFHDTEYSDERAYYYMLAYNGLNQPAKVVDTGGPLVGRPVTEAFEDPMQALSVLYLTATNFQRLGRPTRDQLATGRVAGRDLLAILPSCFTAEHRPPVMTAADWAKSRTDLEALGRETVARAGR
jgi:hypothetical protein